MHFLFNAGSPMMWFGMFHLFIGNAIIGAFESFYISKRFSVKANWFIIILGNYLSMIVGMYFIAPDAAKSSGNSDFWGGNTSLGHYELKGFVSGMVAAFIVTLLVELPFFMYALKSQLKNQLSLFKILCETNLVSYVIMMIIYLLIVAPGEKW